MSGSGRYFEHEAVDSCDTISAVGFNSKCEIESLSAVATALQTSISLIQNETITAQCDNYEMVKQFDDLEMLYITTRNFNTERLYIASELVTGEMEDNYSLPEEEFWAGYLGKPTTHDLQPDLCNEMFGEYAGTTQTLSRFEDDIYLSAWLTDTEKPLLPSFFDEIFGEFAGADPQLYPEIDFEAYADLYDIDIVRMYFTEEEFWGEYANGDLTDVVATDIELWAENAGPELIEPVFNEPDIWGKEITQGETQTEENVIGVFACNPMTLRLRKRDKLSPDSVPLEPEWEWNCDEGFVCFDWLIVPLKDFNFENASDGFFDPVTFQELSINKVDFFS